MSSAFSPGNKTREEAFQRKIRGMRLLVRISNLVFVILVFCLIAIGLFVLWVTRGLGSILYR